ncbi:helix-turn-helix domain-containing protein [Gemmobacter denitrificans]|uniref:Helix-turn-helix transcriptional regulator n=1 Tax=Gemmobacter denitrificans TaxID=3123040 RepID=A0ABU8BWM2_9RHOB
MSVLGVFGLNLRRLCEARQISYAQAARDLGQGKVQFQRMLRGESFPKPNLLQHICRYFSTDARILTEAWPFATEIQHPINQLPIQRAIDYAIPVQDYMPAHSELKDGLYQVWRMSFAYPGRVARILYRVHTSQGARLVKYFDQLELCPHLIAARQGVASRAPRAREVRGFVLSAPEGHSVIMFNLPPKQWVSHMFLSAHYNGNDGSLTGVLMFGRKEYAEVNRMSRVVWVPVRPNLTAVIRAGREPVWHDMDTLPEFLRHELSRPIG